MPAKPRPKPAGLPRVQWDDSYYVRAYRYARGGLNDNQIAEAIGVTNDVFKHWKNGRPALRQALKEARGGDGPDAQATFRQYVYGQLPPELKQVWDRIDFCENTPDGWRRVDALLENQGKTARQHLFLYALVHTSFNPSEACRRVHLSKETLENWRDTDPDFARLMDEIHWHKGNFFEAALVDRVMEGDVASTLFANRTFNADRGYGDTLKVKHQHTHRGVLSLKQVIKVSELDLSPELARGLYLALKKASQPPVTVQAKGPHDETQTDPAAHLPEPGRTVPPLRLPDRPEADERSADVGA